MFPRWNLVKLRFEVERKATAEAEKESQNWIKEEGKRRKSVSRSTHHCLLDLVVDCYCTCSRRTRRKKKKFSISGNIWRTEKSLSNFTTKKSYSWMTRFPVRLFFPSLEAKLIETFFCVQPASLRTAPISARKLKRKAIFSVFFRSDADNIVAGESRATHCLRPRFIEFFAKEKKEKWGDLRPLLLLPHQSRAPQKAISILRRDANLFRGYS